MGKWDRRWVPRRRNNNRRYKDYDYEEPPPSPPSPHHPQSNPPVIRDGSGSSWEIEFCKSVHVPWQKVLTAKKYMYCHENILQWDDSAGEQAFHDAKRTFWEKINGLPLETPLPDPDVYIDKIDWHPIIDPELIADVDREYFHPDETRSWCKSDWRRKKFYNQDSLCDPGSNNNNPWEKESSPRIDSLKGQSENWGQYDNSVNVKNVSDPWEESSSRLVDSSKNSSWTRHVDNSSGWNQELKHQRECAVSNRASDTSWKPGNKDGRYGVQTGWKQDNQTSTWKQWNVSRHDQQTSLENARWQDDFVPHTKAAPNKIWDNKQLKRSFEGSFGTDRGYQSGWRKREGCFQNSQRYKTSRFQVDDHGARWQKER
ncbi:OLC1v1001256C1 [Oldenlandia corymbosa var. corymbosa]|uniref:OLC1v1001256C1 n=1 Tax=Oldenlandia corymbosa var. corymbosa TaxID=529605 RepID=A0AAV1D4W4_OLDCO|nr:OLC1v1001256C1 [Oldenlandia corymbosa var. corymbosa]